MAIRPAFSLLTHAFLYTHFFTTPLSYLLRTLVLLSVVALCLVWAKFVRILTQIKVMILLYSMTSHELAIAFFYWTCFFMLYFLRKIPPFTTIWKYTMIFFAVLVGTVWYNKWKEKNK